MKFSKRRKKQNVDISMLNLIDVIFMLLIFFMIATTFNNYSQFQLSVPKTSAKLEQKEDTKIEVIVNKDKKYFLKINDKIQEVSKEKMSSEFSKLSEVSLKNITLTADEHLEYKDIVDTMSILKNMNIENISLNIQNNKKTVGEK